MLFGCVLYLMYTLCLSLTKYEGVPDRGESKDQNYDWIGSMTHQGLYLVDGVPLLYLLKDLKDK